jgi:hypothetical protein
MKELKETNVADLDVAYTWIKPELTHKMSWGVNESFGERKITRDQYDILLAVADVRYEADFKKIFKINETVFRLEEIINL